MPFDWREFIELGKSLIKEGTQVQLNESKLRSAVSRFYYGAFCFTRNYMEQEYHFKRSGGHSDHKDLQEYLEKQWKSHLFLVAERLQDLQEWREKCDYDDDLSLSLLKDEAKISEQLAQFIISQIENDREIRRR
jgi:hypothetical protein